jgi:hypothetical protein
MTRRQQGTKSNNPLKAAPKMQATYIKRDISPPPPGQITIISIDVIVSQRKGVVKLAGIG